MNFAVKRVLVSSLWIANLAVVLVCILLAKSEYISPIDCRYAAVGPLVFPLFLVFTVLFGLVVIVFKPKLFLLQISCVLICYPQIRSLLPVNISSEPTADERKDYIKVLSYNTMGFGNPTEAGEDNQIIDYIVNSDADIVCLQESGATTNEQLNEQKEKLSIYPYKSEYKVGDDLLDGSRVFCYSKYPIVYINKVYYHARSNGTMLYKLLIDNDTVVVINNHFESNKLTAEDKQTYKNIIKEHNVETMEDDSRMIMGKLCHASFIRAGQVDTVSMAIDSLKDKYPLIVCGDFNDPVNSYTHYKIGEFLTDCHTTAGCGLGISYNQRGFFFRIDNILVNDRWKVKYCKVDKSIDKSDHYPIFAYIKRRK